LHQGTNVHWDYAWTASCWFLGGLTVTPNVNLVTNIGFGEGASNTKNARDPLANIPTSRLGHISHPVQIERNEVADRYVFDHTFGGRNLRFPRSFFLLPRRMAAFIYRKIKHD